MPVTRNFASVTCRVFRDRVVFSSGASSRFASSKCFRVGDTKTRRRENVRVCPALLIHIKIPVEIEFMKENSTVEYTFLSALKFNWKEELSSDILTEFSKALSFVETWIINNWVFVEVTFLFKPQEAPSFQENFKSHVGLRIQALIIISPRFWHRLSHAYIYFYFSPTAYGYTGICTLSIPFAGDSRSKMCTLYSTVLFSKCIWRE